MYAKQFGWTAKKYNCKLIVARSNEHTAMTAATATACAISEFVLATTDNHTKTHISSIILPLFSLYLLAVVADSGRRTYLENISGVNKR